MADVLITFADVNAHALSIGEAIMYSTPQVWAAGIFSVIVEFEVRDCLSKYLHWTFRFLVFWFMAVVSLSLVMFVRMLTGNILVTTPAKWITSGVPIHAATIGFIIMLMIWDWDHGDRDEMITEVEDQVYYGDDLCYKDFDRLWAIIWLFSVLGSYFDAVSPVQWLPEKLLGFVVLGIICPKPSFVQLTRRYWPRFHILCSHAHFDFEDGWETEEENMEDAEGNIEGRDQIAFGD